MNPAKVDEDHECDGPYQIADDLSVGFGNFSKEKHHWLSPGRA
jgi:hypothetical protein